MRHAQRTPTLTGISVVLLLTLAPVALRADDPGPCPVQEGPQPTPTPPLPFKAIIESIVGADGVKLSKAALEQVQVTPLAAPSPVPGEAKMQLKTGDRVKTGPGTTVRLLFYNQCGEQEVYLKPDTTVEVSSVFDWVGTVIVKARGLFEARTRRVRLGVEGTEYRLEAAEGEGDTTLIVMEGKVKVMPLAEPPAGTSAQPPTTAAQAPDGAGESRDARGFAAAAEEVVSKGEVAVINRENTVSKRGDEAAREKVLAAVDEASEVMYAALPSYTAKDIPSDFENRGERLRAFKQARLNVFLNEEDAASYETLAKVYVDAEQPAQAAAAHWKAAALYRKNPAWKPSDQFLANSAAVNVLTKRYDEAERDAKSALEQNPNSTKAKAVLAAVTNRVSNELYVQGDRRGAENVITAQPLTNLPVDLSQGKPSSVSALLTTLGDLSLRQGEIALAQNDIKKAADQFERAGQLCQQAIQVSPQYAHALKCLGDTQRQKGVVSRYLAYAQRGLGKISRFRSLLRSAAGLFNDSEKSYRAALDQHPDFAGAWLGYGTLLHIRTDPEFKSQFQAEAARSYELGVRFEHGAFVELVEVPDVKNKTVAEATKLLTDAGLVPEVSAVGFVRSQSVVAGQKVRKGTKVTLEVSSLPDLRLIYDTPQTRRRARPN